MAECTVYINILPWFRTEWEECGTRRRSLLRGGENKEIPFYVNTETNQVRVVETHFNVCAYRGSNEFTTTLLEGIVDIYAKGSKHSLTRLGGTRFLFSGTESSERSVLLILIISVGKMVYTVLMILLLTCCLVNWRNIIKWRSLWRIRKYWIIVARVSLKIRMGGNTYWK